MSEQPERELPFTEKAEAFYTQEIDRFLSLYADAQGTVQSIFNFYLTFATAIIGGVFFILQSDLDNLALAISGLLLLAALIGSVYLSAISGRYAQSARYAYIVDELRRYIIAHGSYPTPPAYSSLIARENVPDTGTMWYEWLFPTGTYQMFIALMNSGALAVMVLLLAGTGEVGGGRGIFAGLVLFLITLTVYNAYSRLVISRFNHDLHARLNMGHDYSLWASRQ
ncbi:MAG: hypothetical protein RLP44_04005 [Aggregatilineales bacterium]